MTKPIIWKIPKRKKPKTKVEKLKAINEDFSILIDCVKDKSTPSIIMNLIEKIKLDVSKILGVKKKLNNNLDIDFKISEELQFFFDLETDVSSKLQINKMIFKFVKENNLQDENDRRIICVDKSQDLKKLFNHSDELVRIIDINKFTKHHFLYKIGDEL